MMLDKANNIDRIAKRSRAEEMGLFCSFLFIHRPAFSSIRAGEIDLVF